MRQLVQQGGEGARAAREPALSEVYDVDQTAVVGAFGALHLGHEEGAAKELSDLRQVAKVQEIRPLWRASSEAAPRARKGRSRP